MHSRVLIAGSTGLKRPFHFPGGAAGIVREADTVTHNNSPERYTIYRDLDQHFTVNSADIRHWKERVPLSVYMVWGPY